MRWFGSPLPALEFLTTLRFHQVPVRGADEVARSLWAVPLVGALIGLALFGIERGGRELAPEAAVAPFVVLGWIALTGGLHLDGVADSADGLFGGRDRAQRLSIMHDVQLGSWGAIAVVMVLLTKVGLVIALAEEGRFAALLLAPVVARGLVVGAMAATPYARESGYGKALHASARGAAAVVAVGIALAGTGILLDAEGLLVAAWGVAVVAGLAAYARRQVGGLTGDIDGALIEVLEVATLLAIVVGLEQDWLEPLLWNGG